MGGPLAFAVKPFGCLIGVTYVRVVYLCGANEEVRGEDIFRRSEFVNFLKRKEV
jgi:hypothetical protein